MRSGCGRDSGDVAMWDVIVVLMFHYKERLDDAVPRTPGSVASRLTLPEADVEAQS